MVEHSTFAYMKDPKNIHRFTPPPSLIPPDRFINKGLSGRWREVLTDEEVQLYNTMAEAKLSPECRQWLERF